MALFGELLVGDVFVWRKRAWQVIAYGLAICDTTMERRQFLQREQVRYVGYGIWPVA